MFDNPEIMLAIGFSLGIAAGINIARFCWPDEGISLAELHKKEAELWIRIRELEKQEKNLDENIQRKKK